MKKVNAIYKVLFIIAISALVLITIGFTWAFVNKSKSESSYATGLENTYNRNFMELSSTINEIEINLTKLLASNTKEARQTLLLTIWRDTATSQINLSNLPATHESLKDTLSFVNQLGEYCYSLSAKLIEGESFNQADYESLEMLSDFSVRVNYDISLIALNISNGNFSIMDGLNAKNLEESLLNSNLSDLREITVDTPSMIYDGPYSQSTASKEIKGLPETECTQDEARDYLMVVFNIDNISRITHIGNTEGNFFTYNFVLKTKNNEEIFAQVTKRGKFLLQFNKEINNGDVSITKSNAIEKAEIFLENLGLSNMKSVWANVTEEVIYLNMAPVLNNVVIYADLIKVKLSVSSGDICGYEAVSYAYNHIERNIGSPLISPTEARAIVSERLTIKNIRLAIIPKEFGMEVLTYEFECELKNYTYYIYVNADNGKEEEVFRVIESTEGELVM